MHATCMFVKPIYILYFVPTSCLIKQVNCPWFLLRQLMTNVSCTENQKGNKKDTDLYWFRYARYSTSSLE
jgi:hypothetical protein